MAAWTWHPNVRQQVHQVLRTIDTIDDRRLAERLHEDVLELLSLAARQIDAMTTHPLADESGRYRGSEVET